MEDINLDILKTATCLIRKRALELYSLEDDIELREMLNLLGESKLESFFCIIKWPSRCLDTIISFNRY